MTWTTARRGPIFEFPSGKAITRVKSSPYVHISRNSSGHISVLRACRYSHTVGHAASSTRTVYVGYLDPIQGQGQGHGAFELPTIAHNCTFLRLSPPPFSRRAQNWWLAIIVWDLIYYDSSKFPECRYFTTFKWPCFGTAWRYSQMVGYDGSPKGIVHADMTLTRSKVKVKVNVTALLNFRQLAKPCVLAAMTAALLRGFLVVK